MRRRALTLLELLVVMAVIAVLIGLVLFSLRIVRANAERTRESNALRQITQAYLAYASANEGQLMPGYVSPAAQLQLNIRGYGPDGKMIPDDQLWDSAGWMWRLSPYLDDWRIGMEGYTSATFKAEIENEVARGVLGRSTATGASDIGIGEFPAFGLNGVMLGGDDVHLMPHSSGVLGNEAPWDFNSAGTVKAIENLSQAKAPAQTVVFMPTARWGFAGSELLPTGGNPATTGVRLGAPIVQPPQLISGTPGGDWARTEGNATWWYNEDGSDTGASRQAAGGYAWSDGSGPTGANGFPFDRRDNADAAGINIPTSRLDGSIESVDMFRLMREMKYWDPQSTVFREGTNF
ncbi:MAG: type II secretion system protein [Phycisphaerales bacterium]